MYHITDKQLDFIRNDIIKRGIQTKSLQQNILDHICIIIDQNFLENDDFEAFYLATIKSFYKLELREIEEETAFFLKTKNYYTMKKAMIISGAFSAAAFITGSLFKVMHLRFTMGILFLGFATVSFVFLPLLFIVKIKEAQGMRNKLIMATGIILGMSYITCMLLVFIHFPNIEIIWDTIWFTTLAVSFFVFIPVYFFTGIRKQETKVNTIIISILLIAFTSIQFSLSILGRQSANKTHTYIRSKQVLEKLLHDWSDTTNKISDENKLVAERTN